MPAPVTPIVSATTPSPDPRVGLSPGQWDAGQAAWNLKLVSTTPPSEKFLGVTNSDLGLYRQIHHPGQLQRLPGLRHLESFEAGPGADLCVPGVAERRVGLQEPAVRVGRRADRPRRLRHSGRSRTGEQGSSARNPDLRHRGHRQPEVRDQRADLPRLPHPYRGHRPARQVQHLHLCVRFVPGAIGGRAPRLCRWPDRRSEHRAVPARGDSGAARRPAEGGDRQLTPHLQRAGSAAPPGRGGPRRRGPGDRQRRAR